MKKAIIILLAVMTVMFFGVTSQAFAESAPPSDVKKGVFTELDANAKTVVFESEKGGEPEAMKLGSKVPPEDITLNKKVMVSMGNENGEEVVTSADIMFLGLTVNKVIALLIVGLIGGLLSGFIGSGGAFVLTPSMMSLGAPGAVAVASNMCHKFPKAMVGSYKRYKYGQVDLKLGLVMAVTAIIGVQIGLLVQEHILNTWGAAGSDLYVSISFVVILITVGTYVFWDAWRMSKSDQEPGVPKLAQMMQRINIPPMMTFKKAGVRLSMWVTVPVGLATGFLASTIAVGGFVGVPGMIYIVGATAMVASATELLIAFIMGFWGSIQWALSGLVDIRLTLLILAASLFGVQLGALGTTYVKDYTIKVVMGSVMLIVMVSRGAKIPIYTTKLGMTSISSSTSDILNAISFWALIAALVTAGGIIAVAMVKGIMKDREYERQKETGEGAVEAGA